MSLLDFFLRDGGPAGRKRRRARRRPAGCQRQRLAVTELEARSLLTYSITDLGTLGSTISAAYAINNAGAVAGYSSIACSCAAHPFVWTGGGLHDLDSPELPGHDDAYGLNDVGDAVGDSQGHAVLWSRSAGRTDLGFYGVARKVNNEAEVVGSMGAPEPHAFRWKNGQTFDLGTFGGEQSGADGINNVREIVGAVAGINFFHAFAWTESGGMQDLGTLDGDPGSASEATSINDLGQIVGSSSTRIHPNHATYFTPEGNIDLGTLGSLSEAHAVNNLGQVVGDSITSGGDHAFVTDLWGSPMVDLNTLIPPDSGWIRLASAEGINDVGQIVGLGQLPGNDIIHAYLLTPDDGSVAALAGVAPKSTKVQTLTSDACSASGDCFDLRRLRQVVQNGPALGSSPEVGLVAQLASDVARSTAPAPVDAGLPDAVADVLAR